MGEPNNVAEEAFNKANQWLEMELFDYAENEIDKAIDLEPKCARYYLKKMDILVANEYSYTNTRNYLANITELNIDFSVEEKEYIEKTKKAWFINIQKKMKHAQELVKREDTQSIQDMVLQLASDLPRDQFGFSLLQYAMIYQKRKVFDDICVTTEMLEPQNGICLMSYFLANDADEAFDMLFDKWAYWDEEVKEINNRLSSANSKNTMKKVTKKAGELATPFLGGIVGEIVNTVMDSALLEEEEINEEEANDEIAEIFGRKLELETERLKNLLENGTLIQQAMVSYIFWPDEYEELLYDDNYDEYKYFKCDGKEYYLPEKLIKTFTE